jgi:hypothetical protein
MKVLLLAVLPRGRAESRTSGATKYGGEIAKLNSRIRQYVEKINTNTNTNTHGKPTDMRVDVDIDNSRSDGDGDGDSDSDGDGNSDGGVGVSADQGERVVYLDVGHTFVDRQELLYKTKAASSVAAQYYFPDSLHLSAGGYDALAAAIAPVIQRIMGR